MNIYPIQTNFTTGILSPRFWCRSDVAQYRNGVEDCENMIVTRHGPMQSRNGTSFIEDLGDNYARPFAFQLIPNKNAEEAYTAIAVADGRLILNGASGTVYEQELENPAFNLSLDDWSRIYTSGASFVEWSSGAALLNPEKEQNGAIAGISQQVTVSPGTENDNRSITFTSAMVSGTIAANTTISIGTSEGASDLDSQLFYGDSGQLTFNPSGLTTFWITFTCQNTRSLGGGPGEPVESYGERKLFSVSSYLTDSGAIEFVHPWSESDIRTMHVEMSPNDFAMYFVCQNVAPYKLLYNLNGGTWSFLEVPFTGEPSAWGAGNYPTTLGFFQGRSWWGGVESKPQTFWGSKSNDESTGGNELEDLTIGANADDGLEFSLSRSGRIRWIEGGRNLVIGTTSGEFLINGSSGVITPDDVFVSQQSAEGGESVNAKKIGSMVMFISGDGRKLLATRYQEDQNQWRAQEISFTAENLTLGRKITQIAYARNPESIVWCLLDDGTLIGCTYDPLSGVMGWHRHTVGSVQGISASEKAGFSILSMTVQRTINGESVTYLEELGLDYMDSSTTIETTSLSVSVPHLAGETVTVKINDAQHPDITLDENGDGELLYFEDTAIIGLSMPITLTTLEPDFGSQSGTSMGFNKRWSDITARVYNSAVPLINGERDKVRYPATPMGYRENNITGDVSVKSLGFGDGSITISQSLPYKLTLTGIFGKMSQNKL